MATAAAAPARRLWAIPWFSPTPPRKSVNCVFSVHTSWIVSLTHISFVLLDLLQVVPLVGVVVVSKHFAGGSTFSWNKLCKLTRLREGFEDCQLQAINFIQQLIYMSNSYISVAPQILRSEMLRSLMRWKRITMTSNKLPFHRPSPRNVWEIHELLMICRELDIISLLACGQLKSSVNLSSRKSGHYDAFSYYSVCNDVDVKREMKRTETNNVDLPARSFLLFAWFCVIWRLTRPTGFRWLGLYGVGTTIVRVWTCQPRGLDFRAFLTSRWVQRAQIQGRWKDVWRTIEHWATGHDSRKHETMRGLDISKRTRYNNDGREKLTLNSRLTFNL